MNWLEKLLAFEMPEDEEPQVNIIEAQSRADIQAIRTKGSEDRLLEQQKYNQEESAAWRKAAFSKPVSRRSTKSKKDGNSASSANNIGDGANWHVENFSPWD